MCTVGNARSEFFRRTRVYWRFLVVHKKKEKTAMKYKPRSAAARPSLISFYGQAVILQDDIACHGCQSFRVPKRALITRDRFVELLGAIRRTFQLQVLTIMCSLYCTIKVIIWSVEVGCEILGKKQVMLWWSNWERERERERAEKWRPYNCFYISEN